MEENPNVSQNLKELSSPPAQTPGKAEKPKRKISLPVLLVSAFILLVTALALGTIFYVKQSQNKLLAINDFESCAAAGNPVMESYPEQCRTPDGRSFTRVLTEEEQKKLSPDPTSDWNSYKNTTLNFILKYPSRYPKPVLPSGLGPKVYADGTEDNHHIIFGESSLDSFGLQVFPYSGDVDNLINYENTPMRDFNSNLSFVKEVTIDGNKAIWYRATPLTVYPEDEGSVGIIKILFTNNGYGYFFNFNVDYDENEISQILSTFKFTE